MELLLRQSTQPYSGAPFNCCVIVGQKKELK